MLPYLATYMAMNENFVARKGGDSKKNHFIKVATQYTKELFLLVNDFYFCCFNLATT
jgi:hypothetical protein